MKKENLPLTESYVDSFGSACNPERERERERVREREREFPEITK